MLLSIGKNYAVKKVEIDIVRTKKEIKKVAESIQNHSSELNL